MNSSYASRKFLFKGVLKSWPATYPASVNLYDHLGFAKNGDGQPRNTPPDPCQGEGQPFQNVRALPPTEVVQVYPAEGNLYDQPGFPTSDPVNNGNTVPNGQGEGLPQDKTILVPQPAPVIGP
jgi:hypothetical protein